MEIQKSREYCKQRKSREVPWRWYLKVAVRARFGADSGAWRERGTRKGAPEGGDSMRKDPDQSAHFQVGSRQEK